MTIPLHKPIAAYFDVSNGAPVDRIRDCFTPDAVVLDEKKTHKGYEAIESWLKEARGKFEYSVEPMSVRQDGARVTVPAKITGNFPGSPIMLDHIFLLSGEKIQSLEIH